MSEKENQQALSSVLTEAEVEKFLGITKEQLSALRNARGLPFVKLNNRKRLYFEQDLIEFFKRCRVTLNKD